MGKGKPCDSTVCGLLYMFALFEDALFVLGYPQVHSLRSITSGYVHSPPLATVIYRPLISSFGDDGFAMPVKPLSNVIRCV